jgi:hypothetical protein
LRAPSQAGQGLTVFGEARLPGVRAAERFSIVMLAGREAERLYFAEPLPEGSDADDLKGFKLTLRGAGGRAYIEQPDGSFITFEEFLPERIERLRRRTRRLVRDLWCAGAFIGCAMLCLHMAPSPTPNWRRSWLNSRCGGNPVAFCPPEAQKCLVLLHKSSRENGFQTRPYTR